MIKLPLIIITLLLSFVSTILAQNATKKNGFLLGANLGYSRYFVDPDADLRLDGISGEINVFLGKKRLVLFSKDLQKFREITFTCSKVLHGNIDARAISLSYGSRYSFPRIFYGYGFGPFSYLLLSNNKRDVESGYTLDTGLRLHAYFLTGFNYSITKKLTLTLSAKYNFTVKKIYLHNPFARHKHEDIFHYFTISFGVLK